MPLVNGKFTPLELPEKHARVLLDNTIKWRYRVLHGGRNGGKDWSATAVIIERAVRQPIRVLCTREIQKTIKDSIHQLLSDTIARLGYQKYFTITASEIKGRSGSSFVFTGLRDLNADNIKSIEGIDVVMVGEAQNLTEKSWNILNPTIRKPGSEIWISFNDQSNRDFVYRLCVENPPPNMICDLVNYLDVPRAWISAEIWDQAEAMKRDHPELYERIWLGKPGTGGPFMPEFGEHMREMPFHIQPHECNLYGSLDYGDGAGEGAGATSFGLHHIDKMGKPHRMLTYYKRHQTAATYAREIMASIRSFSWTQGVMPKAVFADPSMFIKRRMDDTFSKSVADIFAEYGLMLTPANNDRVNGWRVMRESFVLDKEGIPNSFYWDGYNTEYEAYIPTLQTHPKNPNDCIKGGEDHVADDHRYFCVAAMGLKTTSSAIREEKEKKVMAKVNLLVNVGVPGVVCSDTGW